MDIRLSHLTKTFIDKNSEVKAVNDLDIVIPSGRLIGLLGPSGCGKSTTLYMIAGLYEPTSGQIFFGDEDVTTLPAEKRGIGLVFQTHDSQTKHYVSTSKYEIIKSGSNGKNNKVCSLSWY